jgi:hypothetical protein
MHYDFTLTIPPNTPEDNPLRLTCPLNYGIINKLSVEFPPGCYRLAHIRIFDKLHQVWPTNIDSSIVGDTFPVEFEEYYPVIEVPYELKIEAWNDDDTYQHSIVVRIGLLSEKVLGKIELRPTTEEELRTLLGEYEIIGG